MPEQPEEIDKFHQQTEDDQQTQPKDNSELQSATTKSESDTAAQFNVMYSLASAA